MSITYAPISTSPSLSSSEVEIYCNNLLQWSFVCVFFQVNSEKVHKLPKVSAGTCTYSQKFYRNVVQENKAVKMVQVQMDMRFSESKTLNVCNYKYV